MDTAGKARSGTGCRDGGSSTLRASWASHYRWPVMASATVALATRAIQSWRSPCSRLVFTGPNFWMYAIMRTFISECRPPTPSSIAGNNMRGGREVVIWKVAIGGNRRGG